MGGAQGFDSFFAWVYGQSVNCYTGRVKMIKQLLYAINLFFVILGSSCFVNATLLPLSQSNIIYDTATSKYWILEQNTFAAMNYNQQMSAIGNSKYLDLHWHMSSGDELRDLWLGNGDYFAEIFLGAGVYSGRINSLTTYAFGGDWKDPWGNNQSIYSSDLAHMVGMFTWDGFMLTPNSGFNFYAYDNLSDSKLGAWVVADGPVPVPEPNSFLMLIVGLVGLFFVKTKDGVWPI